MGVSLYIGGGISAYWCGCLCILVWVSLHISGGVSMCW